MYAKLTIIVNFMTIFVNFIAIKLTDITAQALSKKSGYPDMVIEIMTMRRSTGRQTGCTEQEDVY